MTTQVKLGWMFRVALAMCFIGHGMFGVLTKAEWVPLFAALGLSRETAFSLMPLIGLLDIALGIFVLFRPIRAVLLYMTVWTLWTAALRPISGLSVFEMLERAGNYGIPLAMLILLGPWRSVRDWFTRVEVPELTGGREVLLWRTLSLTTALLLIGHGGLAMSQKDVLVGHAAVLGFTGESVVIAGALEIALAFVVLLAPRPAVLLGVAAWKIGTELLYPLAGAPVWEFIERGGSYAAPLALALLAAGRVAEDRRVKARVAALGTAAVLVVLLGGWPRWLIAQGRGDQGEQVPVAPPGITDSLRLGGYVIACRHAATDHDQSDRGPAREQQRNLTAEGEEQSRSIGAAIRALQIPIGEVRANPMYRNQESATHAFGAMAVDSALGGRGSEQALRTLLMAPVSRGTNRAIVTRIGILSGAMRDHGVRMINEGDCFVVQPMDGTDFRVLGRLRVQDWGGSSR